MLALIDHGVGNLRSVKKAFEAVGSDVILTSDPEIIYSARKVVLPGVGAFSDAMAGLSNNGLVEVIRDVVNRGIYFLGICVGMQMLFDISEERGHHDGLGLLPGTVQRFKSETLKIPQTGWNRIIDVKESRLLKGIGPDSYAYFNHSYYCIPSVSEDILAETDFGITYASVVGRDRLFGVQFHPEKSQTIGLKILKNFIEMG